MQVLPRNAAGELFSSLDNASMNDYQNDVQFWTSQGKFWFDPNSEIKPDLDKYLDNMPSAVDSLRGHGVAALHKGDTNTAGEVLQNVFINPAAAKTKNKAISYIINPLSAFDKIGGDGFAGYVGAKAAEGGMAGGAPGAVIGIVKGIFTWFSAKGEDAKNAEKARQEVEIAERDWTVKRNKRQVAEKEADFKNRQAAEATHAATEENKKDQAEAKKLQRISQGRAMMKNVLMNAGKGSQAYRDRRASVKASRRV